MTYSFGIGREYRSLYGLFCLHLSEFCALGVTLPLDVLLIGLTVLGIGAAAYAATCICVYSTPRYVFLF